MLDQTTGEERGGSDEDVYIQCQYRPASQSQISFAIRLVIGPDQQHDDYGVRGLPSAAIKVSRSSSTFEAPGRRRAQRARARAVAATVCTVDRSVVGRTRRIAAESARGEPDGGRRDRPRRDTTETRRAISVPSVTLDGIGFYAQLVAASPARFGGAGIGTSPVRRRCLKKCKTFAPLDQTPI